MPLIKFKISSNLDLARCRQLIKQHENPVIPTKISLKKKLTDLPTIYGFRWSGEKIFSLTRWHYVFGKYSWGYNKGIELIGDVEGTSGKPLFILQAKADEGKNFLGMTVVCFLMFGFVFGIIALFATSKITIHTLLYFSILPLLFSIGFVIHFFINALLCRKFLKKLINPKSSENSNLITES